MRQEHAPLEATSSSQPESAKCASPQCWPQTQHNLAPPHRRPTIASMACSVETSDAVSVCCSSPAGSRRAWTLSLTVSMSPALMPRTVIDTSLVRSRGLGGKPARTSCRRAGMPVADSSKFRNSEVEVVGSTPARKLFVGVIAVHRNGCYRGVRFNCISTRLDEEPRGRTGPHSLGKVASPRGPRTLRFIARSSCRYQDRQPLRVRIRA